MSTVLPMLATPTTFTPTGAEWVHEVKWDGIRLVYDASADRVRLSTRNDNDVTQDWPDVARHLDRDLALDGELFALNERGVPDFRNLRKGAAATFVVFDVMRVDGKDVMSRSWTERRQLLEGLDLPWPVPETYDDGEMLWQATRDQELEGVMSKRRDSPYTPGQRSRAWLKRAHRHRGTYVVGGWRPQVGTTDRLAALLVGEVTDAGLAYRGRVGSGISAQQSRILKDLLVETSASPFVDDVPRVDAQGTHWVEPTLMIEVDTHGTGYERLRQPSFRGVRADA